MNKNKLLLLPGLAMLIAPITLLIGHTWEVPYIEIWYCFSTAGFILYFLDKE